MIGISTALQDYSRYFEMITNYTCLSMIKIYNFIKGFTLIGDPSHLRQEQSNYEHYQLCAENWETFWQKTHCQYNNFSFKSKIVWSLVVSSDFSSQLTRFGKVGKFQIWCFPWDRLKKSRWSHKVIIFFISTNFWTLNSE